MSHLPFTILAYILNGIAVTVDKFLLEKKLPDPLIYIFYYSLVSCAILFLLPFTKAPTFEVFLMASLSTLLWTTGAYFMFKALRSGLLSRVIPVIGTLIPLFLLVDSSIRGDINIDQTWAIIFFILGLIFLTIFEWKGRLSLTEIVLEVASALFFAVSYVILREAYLQENFLSVFVWSRPILIPVGLIILAVPMLRRRVLTSHGPKVDFSKKTGLLFAVGQGAGGISELMLTYSVSLATPALVNSLQGTQYVFLFFISLFLSKKFPEIYKENLNTLVMVFKVVGILFIGLGLYILAQGSVEKKMSSLGVTYSPKYATELGLDPQINFPQALDELRLKNVRLPVYWDEVEENEGLYDFENIEYYLAEAQKREVNVVLSLGFKQPRWPECFEPEWAKGLNKEEKQERILRLLEKEVIIFKNFSTIKIWQIENEPFLNFGDCPTESPLDKEFLQKEVELVKKLDQRPVLITDSGELTNWYESLKLSDIHGISLYRVVWNPLIGTITYPYPPVYYKIKGAYFKNLTGRKDIINMVSELQAEPWVPAEEKIQSWDIEEQIKQFPPKKLQSNLEYAKSAGYKDAYLWGVEWWYFMKEKGHPEYIEKAKEIFKN